MKKILIVINTLGHAGAETALITLLSHLPEKSPKVFLYVLTGQGELVKQLPEEVKLLNRSYRDCSVLSRHGKLCLAGRVLHSLLVRGTWMKLLPYLLSGLSDMVKKGRIQPDKLFWRALSDGGERIDDRYDMAVAFLEGGSAYYVADHVNAGKKVAFLHVDYDKAGYTRTLDRDCYLAYDKIFAVSNEVKDGFVRVYPECEGKTEIFHNILDVEAIRDKAETGEGFRDQFQGKRILTVGRLTSQKALEISVEAMSLLKKRGENVRWYVLGEGNRRRLLEDKIHRLGLEEDFLLPGAVENPYPYMRQADLYVHASRFEGKSIAIQEAQILGKTILVSDCSGSREQVENGVDGVMCPLTAEDICANVQRLLHDRETCMRLGAAAASRKFADSSEIKKLLELVE